MTNAVITYIEKEFGLLKTEVIAIEPDILAWFKNTVSLVTPVIQKAVNDAVIAAITFPGNGEAKAIYALGVASEDLFKQGVPIIESQLKALIQVGYNALPDALKSTSAAQAVVNAANAEVDAVGAKIEPVTPIAAVASPATSGSGS